MEIQPLDLSFLEALPDTRVPSCSGLVTQCTILDDGSVVREAASAKGDVGGLERALDALALFDHAMALMREHVKPTARIHRIVKEGGAAANIIPDHTRGEYWVRDETADAMNEIVGRLRKAAEGAALATETTLFSDGDVSQLMGIAAATMTSSSLVLLARITGTTLAAFLTL